VLLIGLITGAPGMAVPASIIAGSADSLLSEATSDYSSWSYMWTLLPAVGVERFWQVCWENTA